jgi:hypothetical protein
MVLPRLCKTLLTIRLHNYVLPFETKELQKTLIVKKKGVQNKNSIHD